jgi:hypothetical protein
MQAIDLASLAEEGEALDRVARAPTTLRQYHRFWFHFENWCRDAGGFQSLPAHPDTIGMYQEANGVVIAIPFLKDHHRCPVRALRTWLDVADIREVTPPGSPAFPQPLTPWRVGES